MRAKGQSKNVYEADRLTGQTAPRGFVGPQPFNPWTMPPPVDPYNVQLPVQQGSQEQINALRMYLLQRRSREQWEKNMQAAWKGWNPTGGAVR